jgi:triphosphoribosyl-dephospho-CoA synthetase
MERDMFAATEGVNTHKGLIFALSLWLYAAGHTLRRGQLGTPETLGALRGPRGRLRGAGTAPSAGDPAPRPLTHGERLFLEHGSRASGGKRSGAFPASSTGAFRPFGARSAGASRNDAALAALLALMSSARTAT